MDKFRIKLFLLMAIVHSAVSLLANPRSFISCPGKKNLLIIPNKVERYNRTHVAITGTLHLPYVIDDSTEVNVKIAIKSAGVWKDNFFNFQMKNGCKDIKNMIPDFLIRAGKASNSSYNGGCPIPKGDMYVEKMIPTTTLSIPVPAKGEFRATITLTKGGNKYACILVDFDLTRS